MADGDRAWLKKLHAFDRAAALRWLREVGEVRFLRIATAARDRPRGRPTVSYPRAVRRAIHLWVTGQIQYEEAAGKAAALVLAEKDWESGGPVEFPYLRSRIRKEMQAAPRSLVDEVTREATRNGQSTIFDRRQAHISPPFHAHRIEARLIFERRPVQHGIDMAAATRTRRLAAFLEAFEDLIPDDTPISRVAQLFDESHEALQELHRAEF